MKFKTPIEIKSGVLVLLIFSFALLQSGCLDRSYAVETKTSESLLPLNVGNEWIYDYSLKGFNGSKRRFVEKAELVQGKKSFVLAVEADGVVGGRTWLFEDEQGVFAVKTHHGFQPQFFNPPVPLILNSQLKPNGFWNHSAELKGKPIFSTVEFLGVEKVKVRAGEFKAIVMKISNTLHAGEEGAIETKAIDWYARGVGLVKRILESESGPIVLELRKYTVR